MPKEKILISACLFGLNVKYDGKSNYLGRKILNRLQKFYDLVPACSEVFGGLPTPREPAEITKEGKVLTKSGKDVTKNFIRGAREVLKVCKRLGIKKALLKQRSPSCGVGEIYDGTFKKRVIKGYGILARMLKDEGIELFTEEDIEKLLK